MSQAQHAVPHTPSLEEDEIVQGLAALMDRAGCAFFFDIDGTLVDLAPRPDAVVVPDDLPANLQVLHTLAGGALALVSGRSVTAIDALFSPLRLPAAGVHGGELRRDGNGDIEVQAGPLPAPLVAQLAELSARHDNLLMEDKGSSVAIHYRANPEAGGALERDILALLDAREDAREGIRILPGHFVFEIKRSDHDKGTAVRSLMQSEPFAGRRPVFLGDDVTDEAAFAAVRELGGLAVSVGRNRPGASAVIPSAALVRRLVAELAFGAQAGAAAAPAHSQSTVMPSPGFATPSSQRRN